MIQKVFKNKEKLFILFLLGTSVILAFIRSFYGVETTDEAMYLAESYSLTQGGIPYATNWFHSSGYTTIIAPLIKIWETFNGGLDGLFLFTRLMYLVFKIIIAVSCICILKSYMPKKWVYLFVSPLILFAPYSISNFSYNTIPFLLELVVSCLFLAIYKDRKRQSIFVITSAVIVAICCFVNPTNIIYAAWWFILLIFYKSKGIINKKEPLRYAIAGLLVGGAIITILSFLCGGFTVLLEGWIKATKYNPYYKIDQVTFQTQWLYIRVMVKSMVICLLLCLLSYFIITIKKEKTTERKLLAMQIGTALFLLLICIQYRNSANYLIRCMTGGLFLHPWILSNFIKEKEYVGFLLSVFWIPSVLNLTISAGTAAYGISDRAYLLLPGVLIITIFFEMPKIPNKSKVNLFPVMLSIVLACSLFGLMYRDDNIFKCDTKIDSGIYKNLYTTKERGEYLQKLELYLQDIVSENDYVFAQQSFPALYLMNKGKMLTPTAWSAQVFMDGYTGDDMVRNYFEFMNKTPNIILYHYNGIGEIVDMSEEKYPFCKYINTFYEQKEQNKNYPDLRIYVKR